MLPAFILSLIKRAYGSAATWSIGGTALKIGSGILLLPLILRILPQEQLGLWYVFVSFGGLISLLDMGLGTTAVRAITYLWAGAADLRAHGVAQVSEEEKGKPNIEKLTTLMATLRLIYAILGSSSFLLLLTLGSWFIYSRIVYLPDRGWLMLAWFFYAFSCAYNFFVSSRTAALPGIGAIQKMAKLGFCGQVASIIITAGSLIGGLGFFSLVLGNIISAIGVRFIAVRHVKRVTGIHELKFSQSDISLLKILWPQSWRFGGSVIGSFFIFQGNTLICSAVLGLKEAASYALSLQIVTLLGGLCSILVEVKMPLITSWRITGELERIRNTFISRLRLATALYFLGAILVVTIAPIVIPILKSNTDLLPTNYLVLMLISNYLGFLQGKFHSLVITENRNPYLVPLLASAIANVLLGLLLTSKFGSMGLILSQGIVLSCHLSWWSVVQGLRGLDLSFRHYLRILCTASWKI